MHDNNVDIEFSQALPESYIDNGQSNWVLKANRKTKRS